LAAEAVLHRPGKAPPGRGELAQRHREDPLELEHRLLIEDDRVELFRLDAAVLEAPLDCRDRKRGVVLAAREPFLLDGADRNAVHGERRRRVVVVRRDAEDAHQYCPPKDAARERANPSGSRRADRFASAAKAGRIRKYWSASIAVPTTDAIALATRR